VSTTREKVTIAWRASYCCNSNTFLTTFWRVYYEALLKFL
jgi:hypothetical protein